MTNAYRVIALVVGLLSSLSGSAQVGAIARKIVLPNPQLIHCRSAVCSQLWKQDSEDGRTAYPAQVLTDFVNGQVVGLTAVYDNSVSMQELRAAIDAPYATSRVAALDGKISSTWRVDPEKLVVQLLNRDDGTKQLIYLTIGAYGSHVPSAHIDPSKQIDCGK